MRGGVNLTSFGVPLTKTSLSELSYSALSWWRGIHPTCFRALLMLELIHTVAVTEPVERNKTEPGLLAPAAYCELSTSYAVTEYKSL